jgi:hypothetical protein
LEQVVCSILQQTNAKGGEKLNYKRFLLIALVAAGLMIASASRSDAGVSVGIGIGFPVGYVGYGYAPYGYTYPAYYYPRPVYYPAPVVYTGVSYYWHNGHRVYYGRRCR